MEKLEVRSVPELVSPAERAGVLGNASGSPWYPTSFAACPTRRFLARGEMGRVTQGKRCPENIGHLNSGLREPLGECAWPPRRRTQQIGGHSQLNKEFIGDGAVVSYLNNKGDNDETYGNGTCVCVRALQHLRICPHSSSQVERQDPYRAYGWCTVSRLASKIWQSDRQR
jgi:hypothetical protein